VGRLLALNVALILAITSPLWLAKAYVWSHIFYTTVATPPNATPEETAAYLRRFVTPPMWQVLLREVFLTGLTYLAWVLLLGGICRTLAKHRTRSDRLETWSVAARQRLAYLLCWPIPWLGTALFGFANWFLLPALPNRSAVRKALETAYDWALAFWWPTIPVLVFVGLFLACRRTRRHIRELRSRVDPPAG
jgi:hypothetical protein